KRTLVSPNTVAPMRAVLASNAMGYGVAWMDYRTGGPYETRFVRLTKDGDVIDGSESALGTSGIYQGEPSVASNGDEYAIVWDEQAPGDPYSDPSIQDDLWLTRITNSGTVVYTAAKMATPVYEWWGDITSHDCIYALAYNYGWGFENQFMNANLLIFSDKPP